jgi:predicted DNA-binding protein
MTDYTRTQILLEKSQHHQLKEIAENQGKTFSELVREYLDAQLRLRNYEEMRLAAHLLRENYIGDADLTDTTALDGEDFLNEKG